MTRTTETTGIVNLSKVREEKIEERRREYERIVFKNTLGVYTVMDQSGLHAIDLIDISEGGLSFQVPEKKALEVKEGDNLNLRFYISTDTYILVGIKVVRSFSAIDQGQVMHRYGCLIDKTMASYAAIFHFVQFIAKCAEHGHKEESGVKVYY